MESRARLAIGGMSAVAASVAVVCAVALTNSVALSDAQGASVEAGSVVVPSSGAAASGAVVPTPSPVATAAPVPEIDESSTPEAEVVPAPAPQVVGTSPTSPSAERPAAAPSDGAAIAEAEATGSWASVREWAARLGWSNERIDAWIAKLEKSRGSVSGDWRGDDRPDSGDSNLVADSDRGKDSDRDGDSRREGSGSGWSDSGRDGRDGLSDADRRVSAPDTGITTNQERSTTTDSLKERPAHAGANAEDRSEKPGGGAKKDRSRDSPERRDR